MIMDKQLLASDAQAVTVTALSTNAIDLGSAGRDISRNGAMRAIAEFVQAFAGGTSVKADLVESANSDLSSSTVLAPGVVIVTASATAGVKALDVLIPTNSKRYVGFNYTVVGTMTAGKVTAGLVENTDSGTFNAANTGF